MRGTDNVPRAFYVISPMTFTRFFLLFTFLFSLQYLSAQSLPNVNQIYDAQIRTVKLHLRGLPTSQPILDLQSNNVLRLSFDDLTGESMAYFYTVYHCNADWQTSDIQPLEYLSIFEEGEIRTFYQSGRTEEPYLHYTLEIPNREINWTISGNYMLVVYYYDGDTKVPIFTRRFMSVENQYSIDAQFLRPRETSKIRTHHEIRASVNINKTQLRIPHQQIRLYVYQNGRWDRSSENVMFNRFLGDDYYYDLQGQLVFPASKEFRFLDNRFINSPGGNIAYFERNEDGFLAIMEPDRPRLHHPYLNYFDLNGQYVIMDREANFTTIEEISYDEVKRGDTISYQQNVVTKRINLDSLCLKCEYINVLFNLQVDAPYPHDVYVFGEVTGWTLDPEFKMEYDPSRKAYFAKILLKQGYYDYMYALDTKNGIDTKTIEGLSDNGENDYLFLVYDRHEFNRGDRLVGARMINSSP